MDIETLALAKKYARETAVGAGGLVGPMGPQGLPGKDGKDGKDGVDGKSAYQIALDNGFVGTEQDWLDSLKGSGGGGNGTNDHALLINRDKENQHPIESISGFDEISNADVLRIWNGV